MKQGNVHILLAGLLLLCLPFLIVHCAGSPGTGSSGSMDIGKEKIKPVGGPCDYRDYPGEATIVSILPQDQSTASSAPYQGFDVRFMFSPKKPIKEAFAQVQGNVYPLTLMNSWPPGPKFLHKYGISVGKTFDCTLKVITKGTCTPVLFDFPTINRGDYFEAK